MSRSERVFFVRVRRSADPESPGTVWRWQIRETRSGRTARGSGLGAIGEAMSALLAPQPQGTDAPAGALGSAKARIAIRPVVTSLSVGLFGYAAVRFGNEGIAGEVSGLSGVLAALLLFGIGLPAIMASWYLLYRIVLGRGSAAQRRSVSAYAFVSSLFACALWLIVLEVLFRRVA